MSGAGSLAAVREVVAEPPLRTCSSPTVVRMDGSQRRHLGARELACGCEIDRSKMSRKIH